MDRLPVQPIRRKKKKSDTDSKQREKKEAINIIDTPTENKYQVFHGKSQKVKQPRSCDRVCSLPFTFERQEGLRTVSDLRKDVWPLKVLQLRV